MFHDPCNTSTFVAVLQNGAIMLIFKVGKIEIWTAGLEFLVYGVTVGGDPIACPSIGMAYEVAAR
jgi:hypothetical protein